MARLFITLSLFISFNVQALDLKVISYNLGTKLLKKNKKGINKVNSVINYYNSSIHLFQNTFNSSADLLKTNNYHPYYSYDSNINKRTGTIITSEYPIISERFHEFERYCSLWKTYGITQVKLKVSENKNINVFNVSLPNKKKKIWSYILEIEKFVKRIAYEDDYILAIEFNSKPGKDILDYLALRLNLTDTVTEYLAKTGIEEDEFKTGHHKKNPARTNYLFMSNFKNSNNKTLNIKPIFNGLHDENRYLKDAALLYNLAF
jgi:hypothetical protein